VQILPNVTQGLELAVQSFSSACKDAKIKGSQNNSVDLNAEIKGSQNNSVDLNAEIKGSQN